MFFDFVNPPLMAIEILCGELIVGRLMTRRNGFRWRLGLGAALCLLVTVWIEFIYFIQNGNEFAYGESLGVGDSVFKFFYYLIIFVMTIGCCLFCYKDSFSTVLFCCSAGYAAQHFAVNLVSLFKLIPYFKYAAERESALPQLLYLLIELAVCFAVYLIMYLLVIRFKTIDNETKKGLPQKALISFLVVFVCIGGSRLMKDNPVRNDMSVLSETLITCLCCLLLIYIFSILTTNEKVQHENEIILELLHREREQSKLTKETTEIINIKCHDLKHQIALLRGKVNESDIRQIEDSVMFYDNVFKTGNDVLDVILTEKSMYCESKKIRLNVVINGNYLNFMDGMDICSLFGNALSNAIETVSNIADESRRCVNANVRTGAGMTFIHIENYYEGEIRFENGLPVTSKDKSHHGFGMKSMAYISKKYKGNMTCGVSEGKFNLDFSFPYTFENPPEREEDSPLDEPPAQREPEQKETKMNEKTDSKIKKFWNENQKIIKIVTSIVLSVAFVGTLLLSVFIGGEFGKTEQKGEVVGLMRFNQAFYDTNYFVGDTFSFDTEESHIFFAVKDPEKGDAVEKTEDLHPREYGFQINGEGEIYEKPADIVMNTEIHSVFIVSKKYPSLRIEIPVNVYGSIDQSLLVSDFLYEAEDADLYQDNVLLSAEEKATRPEADKPFLSSAGTKDGEACSGGACLRNFQKRNMKVVFEFVCSEDITAELSVLVCMRTTEKTLGGYFDIALNGVALEELSDMVVPKGSGYFTPYAVPSVTVQLKRGLNTFTLESGATVGKNNPCNLDGIRLTAEKAALGDKSALKS